MTTTQRTFSVFCQRGNIVVRDDDTGEVVGEVPIDVTITAATDSWAVVDAVRHLLPGTVNSVEHDRGEILVTCRGDYYTIGRRSQ